MEHGFNPPEWHNGDVYLAGLIGRMALQHRDNGNGYPASMTPEGWKTLLSEIGEPLVAYADGAFNGSEPELREKARKALHLFADNFENLWD